jgi:hypothetical protein
MLFVTHIFDDTHYAQWKRHMLDRFHELGPKAWWIIVVGFPRDALDKDNLTQAQEDCLQLDTRALYYLTCALHDDVFRCVWDLESAHDMWIALQAFYDDFSTCDDGKFKKKDDPKESAHECVEHDHNLVIVEDCSTSWSSDDDDRSTTSSLDKIDNDATSDARDNSTTSTLGGDLNDVGSCSSHDHDATTSSPSSPHCFMS